MSNYQKTGSRSAAPGAGGVQKTSSYVASELISDLERIYARKKAALVTNPHLLILDEATEGLAPLVREEIWRCLAQLRAEGQAILVIDKYVQRLVGLADRHTIIERGRVVWQGDSATLAADPALWERYIGV